MRFLTLLLSFTLIGTSSFPLHAQPMVMRGGRLPESLDIERINGRPFVQLSDVARWVNGNLRWSPLSEKARLSIRSHVVHFIAGDNHAVVDGRQEKLESAPVKNDAGLWIPLSFLKSQIFRRISQMRVEWSPTKSALKVEPIVSLRTPQATSLPQQTLVIAQLGPGVKVLSAKQRGRLWKVELSPVVQPPLGRWTVDDECVKTLEIRSEGIVATMYIEMRSSTSAPRWDIEEGLKRALVVRVPKPPEELPRALKPTTLTAATAPEIVKPLPATLAVAPEPILKAAEQAPPVAVAPLPVAETRVPKEKKATKEQYGVRRIVVDAGHGGKDPGAIGAGGTEEKAINLALALELAETLRAKDFEVILTRTDDTFIPLEDRARLANEYHADLFVSIHCNASLSSKLKGFEVYFLSEDASDPHAASVARFENAPLAMEKRSRRPRAVEGLLRSLERNDHINAASRLGSFIDRQAAQNLSQPRLGVKQAGFYVLRGAEMPAVLVETGFLTHKKEEKLLRDKRYRLKLIRAIEDGIVDFARSPS